MAARRRRTRKQQRGHPNWDRPRENGRFVSKQRIPVGAPGALEAGLERPGGGPARATDVLPPEPAPFVEIGATGLRHFSGVIDEEFLPALRGQRAIKVFTEMRENDPMVGAMLFAVEMLMRQVEWRIEPGSSDPADVELAAFVDSCRHDMSETWEDTLASIFSFLPFGFSVHEEVFKRRDGPNFDDPESASKHDDGRIGWKKLPVRAQETIDHWIFDPATDALRGVVQLPPPTYTYRTIPQSKFLLFRTTAAKANPQGRSILRNAYRPWYFKRRIEEIEGIGIERDLAGLPMMQIPSELLQQNAPPEKKALVAEIRKMLRDVRRDEREGIIVPRAYDREGRDLYTFELVRSGGRRQFDTTSIINRYDRLIASVVLADFILLGQQRVGALSLSEDKTELFGVALGAWLDSVTAIFNRVAIPRLLLVNGIQTDTQPQLVHGDIETVDIADLGEYVAKLTGAGMPLFPDPEVENWLRGQAGIPELKPDDVAEREAEEEAKRQARLEALRNPPPQPPPPQPGGAAAGSAVPSPAVAAAAAAGAAGGGGG